MDADEQVFNFLAAAEDTGKQLDDLIKAIPGEVRQTLSAEYQKSPWVTSVPETVDRVTAAAERAESAAGILLKKATVAGAVVCIGAVVLPLLTWGYAYWQTSKLRDEQAKILRETERLQRLASSLKDETGGGVVVEIDDAGKRYVALPFGVEYYQSMRYEDGRIGFRYTWPPVAHNP